MEQFTRRHESQITGMLSGFDRVRLRGTLRWLANRDGLRNFLWTVNVLFKDFKDYAMRITERIRLAMEVLAGSADRPVRYLNSSAVSKEDTARRIAAADGVTEGLICVLTCVEPCCSYEVGPNRKTRLWELRSVRRKCLHHYYYAFDPVFGFMHLRLQTWFPFTIHVCINGREWLCRDLDAAKINYVRRGNCLTQVADVAAAQRLLDAQPKAKWSKLLDPLVARYHPTHATTFAEHPTPYYWSADETEVANDVMFKSSSALKGVYERLVRHSMLTLGSADVLRFLGQKVPASGRPHGNFTGELVSDMKHRVEGVRVSHRLNHNSIKMYDKQGSVLRVETTINDARGMKCYRRKEGAKATDKKQWLRMRKGVADLPRRVQISRAANERYLNSLATVDHPVSLGKLTAKLCEPARWQGRRVRALNPLSGDDLRLLEVIRRGEFLIHGMRNRDVAALLFKGKARHAAERRRRASKVTRLLQLLRGHGLIRKVKGTHRYLLTSGALATIDALLAARRADVQKLQQLAA